MSALCLLRFAKNHEKKYALLFFASFAGGALVKETALVFLPGASLLASAVQGRTIDKNNLQTTPPGRFLGKRLLVLGGILVVLLYYFLRSIAFSTNAKRLKLTITAFSGDWMNSLFVILRAFGFYMKKLVIPFPLNIAIIEVDPLYEVPAVFLVALCMFIATRKSLTSSMFISGVLFITPAFFIALGQIAWTPYAERYLYIASAFIIISAVAYLDSRIMPARNILAMIMVPVVLSALFLSTLQRSITWKSDIALYKDAVEKSPMSRELRMVYGELLIAKGEYAEALEQFKQGRMIFSDYDERFDLNISHIYYKQGRLDDAIKQCEVALQMSHYKSVKALKQILELLTEKKKLSRTSAEKNILNNKILEYMNVLFALNHDPGLLFDISTLTAENNGRNDMIQPVRPRLAP